MKKILYHLYTQLFGDTPRLNSIKNVFSDNSIQMDNSVTVGRKTQITGNVDIGPNVSISNNVSINGNINIDEYSNLNGNNLIIGDVNIGKYCAVAPRARMRARDHTTDKAGIQMEFYKELGTNLPYTSKGPIQIKNDVWVCSDAKILSGVRIGNGAVIAADSVVVDDVEPYSIVAGNPANHKKYRFDQSTIRTLQEIAWWDWSEEKQKRNVEFFDADLCKVEDVWSLIEE